MFYNFQCVIEDNFENSRTHCTYIDNTLHTRAHVLHDYTQQISFTDSYTHLLVTHKGLLNVYSVRAILHHMTARFQQIFMSEV